MHINIFSSDPNYKYNCKNMLKLYVNFYNIKNIFIKLYDKTYALNKFESYFKNNINDGIFGIIFDLNYYRSYRIYYDKIIIFDYKYESFLNNNLFYYRWKNIIYYIYSLKLVDKIYYIGKNIIYNIKSIKNINVARFFIIIDLLI